MRTPRRFVLAGGVATLSVATAILYNYLSGSLSVIVAIVAGLQVALSVGSLLWSREGTLSHGKPLPEGHYSRAEDVVSEEVRVGIPQPPEPRVFDVTLRRGEDVDPAEDTVFVGTTCALQAGGTYYLDARIGRASPRSVVRGPQPDVDSLLPDSDAGHDLEVVVYAGGFGLVGRSVQRLRLPVVGPSETVTFDLLAPAETGRAWLRISVLHQDNLIQTYRLVARVEEREDRYDQVVTAARLEYSATAAWANVTDFRRRYISLVLNTDPIDGTHRVFVKSGETALDFSVSEGAQEAVLGSLRKILTEAARNQQDPEAALRALAEQGSELWGHLFNQLRGAEGEPLRELAQRSDEILQITRAQQHHAVPWTLVYDWLLPKEPGTVCWGRDPSDPTTGCAHTWDSKVVCVRGFWGVRHQVEERFPASRDLARHLVPHGGKLAIDLALAVSDSETDGMVEDLDKVGAARRLDKQDQLLTLLWDPVKRAPVVTILGHHNTTAQAISCGTAEGTLTPHMITQQRLEFGSWSVPAPLVFLLACRSGALLPQDVTSHVAALTGVGASGVVATECVIMSHHARQFAASMLGALVGGGTTVGAAMQVARQCLLATKQVPGLAFVAFGSADVILEPA